MKRVVESLFSFSNCHMIDRGYFIFSDVVLVRDIGNHSAGTIFPLAHIADLTLYLIEDAESINMPDDKEHRFKLSFCL